MELRVP